MEAQAPAAVPPAYVPPRAGVIQGIIKIKESGETFDKLDSDPVTLLEDTYKASDRVVRILKNRAKSPKTFRYDDRKSAVTKARATAKKQLRERLQRTNSRNLLNKAKPQEERSLLEAQTKHNYGYEHTEIDEGDILKGKFRRGFASQPFLSLNKDDFGGAVVGSDYDSLVKVFEKSDRSDSRIATDMLNLLETGEFNEDKYDDEETRAISTMVQLTQFIEPHKTRIPGTDKVSRASLRRIKRKKSTFKKEFNRKDGNFLPGRAVKGGSKYGGQQAVRAFLGKPKKNDKAKFGDVDSPDIYETLEFLSESSEEEDNVSPSSSSSDDSSTPKKKRKRRAAVAAAVTAGRRRRARSRAKR